MQAEVIRRDGSEAAQAMARVRNHLQELEDKLDFVQPLADEIDRRTAEFTRLSLARSRYLQESRWRASMPTNQSRERKRILGRCFVELCLIIMPVCSWPHQKRKSFVPQFAVRCAHRDSELPA